MPHCATNLSFSTLGSFAGSLWWQWTAPADGWWEIETNGELYRDVTVQVLHGTRLDTLIPAEDGGLQPARADSRRLFRVNAGTVCQFAVCLDYWRYDASPQRIIFTLRPVTPAANVTVAARTALRESPEHPGIYRETAWSRFPERPPVSGIYAPLFWEWTAPATGKAEVSFRGDFSYPEMRIYRGTEVVEERRISDYSPEITAGEKLLIITGSRQRYLAIARQTVEVSIPREPEYGSWTNRDYPYTLNGPLPRTAAPPDGAAKTRQYWWRWDCPVSGWVEFDGQGLVPELHRIPFPRPGSALPKAIPRDGKFCFWMTAGTYDLAVTGWRWPVAGSSFTLRVLDAGALPPPANDEAATAVDLGAERETFVKGTLAGATRSPGDPADALPTVWYRWRSAGSGTVQVFGPKVSVFTGEDPLFRVEHPVREGVSVDELTPRHVQFNTYSGMNCLICVSGVTPQDFTLRLRLATEGTFFLDTPLPSAVILSGNAGGEAAAVSQHLSDGRTGAWFRWTAAADGWIEMAAPSLTVKVFEGLTTRKELPWTKTAPVTAGQTYWFSATRLRNPDEDPPRVIALRLAFTPFSAPNLQPETAVDLGSQLPVQGSAHLLRTSRETPVFPYQVKTEPVWFRWTAPPGAEVIEVICSQVSVYEETANSEPVLGFDRRREFGLLQVTPGRVYWMKAEGTRLTLEPRVVFAAPNDARTQALPLSLTGGAESAWSGAAGGVDGQKYEVVTLSAEPGETPPDPAQPAAVHSAWWTWTAPRSGLFTASCLNAFGSVDSWPALPAAPQFALAVFQGDSLEERERTPGSLTLQRPRLYNYGQPVPGRRFTFHAAAGQTYFLQAATSEPLSGLTVGVQPGDAYDEWITGFSGLDVNHLGPDDNPSGDGLPNLLKFTLGLNPALSSGPGGNDPAADRAPVWTTAADGGVSVTFRSSMFNTGNSSSFPGFCTTARMIAEWSADLTFWQPLPDPPPSPQGDDRWRIHLPPDPAQPKRFLRLRAQWCPGSLPQ